MLALVSINFATSQVTGKVSGADGTPITGVNVVEKGTSNGAISDFDGNYEISAASNATLVFSYVGYETLEVAVANQHQEVMRILHFQWMFYKQKSFPALDKQLLTKHYSTRFHHSTRFKPL